MKKLVSFAAVALLMVGCVNDDLDKFQNLGNFENNQALINKFDFSTTSEVALSVDYSANNPGGPVFFSVYSENPMKDDVLDENIKPIYSGYTAVDGRFNETVQLPSYAEDLYVYSGNFFANSDVMNAKVVGNAASVTAEAFSVAAKAPARRRASDPSGVSIQNLETMYQLSYEVNWRTGEKIDNQIYNDWKAWLGSWDKYTGRPDYLMTPSTINYNQLHFTEDEMKGIYQSITGAITRKETCPMEYRQSGDLTLKENSEVAVTLIGSNTCWNNTIGYYYYKEGQEPKNLKDIHVIMLFPNTQDGHSEYIAKHAGGRYYGNIALDRGDEVKLMYYPHIASNDMSDATPEFPAGTCIGFLLKSNGWAMQLPQGDKVFHNGYIGTLKDSKISRQYNCWAASTDGLSYCPECPEQNIADVRSVALPNPDGVSRTAKFAYQNEQGQQYAIVSFEDAANDEDYGDVILAMKPVGVFKLLPTVKPRVTTTTGVYAFEDLWPSKGDYDMNDAVVDYKEEREFSVLEYGGEYKITKQTFSLTTYQNYVEQTSGLALTLNTKTTPTSIVMKKISPDGTNTEEVTFPVDGKEYLLTSDIKSEINTTYVLELNYATGIATKNAASVKPFIYRDEANNKRWEVHIPMEAPTAKMNLTYFGKNDDASDPSAKRYYVRKGDYPFSFFLSEASVDVFKNTILLRTNESKKIDQFFPQFIGWSQSGGKENKEWYKHPAE